MNSDYEVRPVAHGGARAVHLPTGETAECRSYPVYTLNSDVALAELRDRIEGPAQ